MYDVGNKNAMIEGGGGHLPCSCTQAYAQGGGCKKRTIAYKGGRGC